jgi:hypothetical protein
MQFLFLPLTFYFLPLLRFVVSSFFSCSIFRVSCVVVVAESEKVSAIFFLSIFVNQWVLLVFDEL